MSLATIIRLEFAYPGVGILAGDSLQYLSIATAHGVIMVFFMIMPLIFGGFGNFLLPTQLGVHDVAFPRLNSAAFWFIPGGLIMLCQLVCIDRRYQRMNCFNIRELQGILKRRFFTDLVNSNNHRDFLNNSIVSVRFKLNNSLNLDPDIFTFYNFGLLNTTKVKSVSSFSCYNFNFFEKNCTDYLISLDIFSYLVHLKYLLYVFFKKFLFNWVYFDFYELKYSTLVIIRTCTSIELLHEAVFNLTTLSFKSFFTFYNYIFNLKSLFKTSFNVNFSVFSEDDYYSKLFVSQNKFFFKSELLTQDINNTKFNFSETTNYQRFIRFNNPLISYDYKCGNYLGI